MIKALLTDDHRELDCLLDQLYSALDSCRALEVYERLDLFWARLAMHIRAEHLHLFPALLKNAQSSRPEHPGDSVPDPEDISKAIEELHGDHDFFMRELANAVKIMRRLGDQGTPDSPEGLRPIQVIVDSVREKLESHNEFEESRAYRWAEELLPSEDWRDLKDRMKRELENIPPRFR